MATIKYHNNNGDWVSLYADAIKNRLRKDKNLSDLLDVAEARKNLELTGDNNHTHYHDDRYLPKIEKEVQDRTKAISDEASIRANAIANESNERAKADEKENKERLTAETEIIRILNKEIKDRTDSITDLRKIVDTKAYFDSRGRLVYPNGDLLWIE